MKKERRTPNYLALLIAAIALLVVGIYLGGHPNTLPKPLRDTLTAKTPQRTINDAIEIIESDYFRPVNDDKMVDDSLNGLVKGLHDRFSAYLNPREYQAFLQAAEGEFSGIGVAVIPLRRGLRVQEVFDNSPAQKAEIKVGDLITAVDGKSVSGLESSIATNRIKGKPGTVVSLTIVRDGMKRNLKLKRAQIEVPVVEGKIRNVDQKPLAVVSLSSFSQGAHIELRQIINQLLKRGAQGIVLDLRGNGGGLLSEAIAVASVFIAKGVIVTTSGRKQPKQVYNASGNAISGRIPVVVLVDRGSASASEIVAGAMQDHKRAQVIGTRTFGKGVFQQLKTLPNDGALDLTVGEYFLPSGRNIGDGSKPGQGIKPNQIARDLPKTKSDEAQQKALQLLATQVK